MSNYTQTTFFTPKDTLPAGNPAKTIFGAAYDVEFGNIATAITSKYDSSNATNVLAFLANSTIFTFSATLTTVIPTLGVAGNTPIFQFQNTAAAANVGYWQEYLTGAGSFILAAVLDSGASPAQAIGISRNSTPAITGITFGDGSALTTFSFAGSNGALTRSANGNWAMAQPPSGAALVISGSTANGPLFQISSIATAALSLANTSTTSFCELYVTNDQNSTSRAAFLTYTGSAFVGPLLTGGLLGECGAVGTAGAFGFGIATNDAERIRVNSNGLVVINSPASGNNTLNVSASFATNGISQVITANVGGAGACLQLVGGGGSGANAASLIFTNGLSAGASMSFGTQYFGTGAQTATFVATNKPGSGTTAPVGWLTVSLNGTLGYVPVWT